MCGFVAAQSRTAILDVSQDSSICPDYKSQDTTAACDPQEGSSIPGLRTGASPFCPMTPMTPMTPVTERSGIIPQLQ